MPKSETKKELKAVLEHICEGVLFIDHEGTIKLYNKTLANMFSIDEDLTGRQIYSLPQNNSLRQGIFRAEKSFQGPYCWERNQCSGDTTCPGKNTDFCRCWLFKSCGSMGKKYASCKECPQYQGVKTFLEKTKELEIGEKVISVLSSFVEYEKKDDPWEVLVFRDVTSEKLDAAVKLANAAAHELRQPLQIITSSVDLAGDKIPEGSDVLDDFQTIKEGCYRLNEIIERLSQLTRYKTKHYIQDESILDIKESAKDINLEK